MNTKKSITLLLLSTLLISFFSACNKYESPLDGARIDDVNFGFALDNKDIVLGDMSSCRVESSALWCFAYIQENGVKVVVEENTSWEDRTAVVTLTDDEDGSTLSFNVNQRHRDALLVYDTLAYTVPQEANTLQLEVHSNVDFTVELNGADWVSVVPSTRGQLTKTIVELAFEENNSGNERVAEIGLKSVDSDITTTVTVTQEFFGYIRIDKEWFDFDENGGEATVTVTANTPFRVEPHESWLQEGTRTETGHLTYAQKITVSPLPSDVDSRRGLVYIVNKDLSVSKVISFQQTRSSATGRVAE